jgi:hypothetical protein
MSDTPDNAENHVVAVFEQTEAAERAWGELRDDGFPEGRLSILAKGQGHPETGSPEDLADAADTAGAGVAKGSAIGGAAGAAVGLLGGALAVALPGVGTALGVGMIVGAASGAAAGGTAGALWSGFERMWDMGYRDLVADGGVLVAVHTDDPDEADRAKKLLAELGPVRIDQLDRHGEVVRAA